MYSDVFYQRIHWVENLFKPEAYRLGDKLLFKVIP